MDVKGKSIILTGAASGIALRCAQRFAAEGAQVILADYNIEKAETEAVYTPHISITYFDPFVNSNKSTKNRFLNANTCAKRKPFSNRSKKHLSISTISFIFGPSSN